MKLSRNLSKKINILFFILVSICAIIVFMIKTRADDNLNMRQVRYQLGSAVNYELSFYTDSPKFHTKASGYEKYKGMDTENNMNSIMATDMVKMQGYGNYEFKPDTNLFSFIDYCYSKDPATTMACAYRAGTTEADTWDYTKLMSYRDSSVNTSFFKYFWQNMSNSCPNFKDYQDDYFFLKYTYPATQKIGINLAMMRNLNNDGESLVEYLTCLTSYIFSITPGAQVEGMTFGKGDVVPFLYYKASNHANIDIRHDSGALMDIAKYAYVALIEGWCKLPTQYHLWENEYNFLFGNYEPENLDYDLETLHEWYDETYQRYCKDKGRKGNNLLGSDINHIIESDYSIEQQLEATEQYIRDVFTDLGIETDFKETMARNELMAKYMMEHSNFDATIKDYNVTIEFMTENLQRGTHEEQNTHTVVTSDFQKLEFPYTMDKRNVNHSDEDGISDGVELGNEKWINITEFVKKTYEDAVRKGDPHKATFEEQVEDIIEKNGAYTDFNGNKVYGSVKWNDDKTKVLYRVYDYKSNPKLNDTDFDGLWDNNEKEEYIINNKFVGGTIIENGNMPVEFYSDFRWFMTNPNKYNDELSVMSLIMSNLANGKTININQLNLSNDIESFLGYLGFDSIYNKEKIKLDEAIMLNANVYIGYKEIKYYDAKKIVYGVFIGGLDNNKAYRKLVANNDDEKIAQYYNCITNDIINYINNHSAYDTNNICYWITGKGVAGAVANAVAKGLIDNGNETFCYTFGAPKNNTDGSGVYSNIKNIINEDDLIPKLLKSNDKFSKYGERHNGSVYLDYMREYIDLFENNYDGDYKTSNNISNEYVSIRQNLEDSWFYDRLSNYLEDGRRMLQEDLANTQMIGSHLDKYKKSVFDAKNTKAYYVLSKNINGYDKNIDNYDDYCEEPDSNQVIVVSKDLVIGDGTREKPFYSQYNDLKFNTTLDEFWCKFIIDGATDASYFIPNNYIAKLYTKTTVDYQVIREWNDNGKDLIYKLSEINNYENEYLVQFVCLESTRTNNHIEIKFEQHYDIKEFDNYIVRWERDEEGVILRDDIFKYKTYCGKELAPTIVYNELNEDEETINKIVNGLITIKDVIDKVKLTTGIVLAAIEGYSTGGLLIACRSIGAVIIRDIVNISNISDNVFLSFLSNRYSTENYKRDLVNESGYHLENITAYVSEIQQLAVCDYSIAIYERYLNPITYLGGVGRKMCIRWEDNLVYGIPGIVGRWTNENN